MSRVMSGAVEFTAATRGRPLVAALITTQAKARAAGHAEARTDQRRRPARTRRIVLSGARSDGEGITPGSRRWMPAQEPGHRTVMPAALMSLMARAEASRAALLLPYRWSAITVMAKVWPP